MPTYDYRCKSCGHQFEKFQSITSEPIRVCPVCGKDSVVRLLTGGAGLIFKGTGFYITDYKNNNKKKKSDENKTLSKKSKTKEKPKETNKPKE